MPHRDGGGDGATHQHFAVIEELVNLALGYALAATKDPTGALAALAAAQPALEREYGPEHEEVASLWEARADAYDEQGKVDEALSAYQKSIAIRRKVLGPKHESVAAGLYNLGTTLNKRERWAEALPCLEEAEKIYIGARSKSHVSVGICAFERGRALRGLGRHAEAVAALEMAQPLVERQLDDATVIAELRRLLASARHDANGKTR